MNLDLAKLRYFIVAARTENLQEAARLLRLSPGAISKAIKALESEFERQLFIRSGKKVFLTDEGQKFARYAQEIIDDVEHKLYGREASKDLKRPFHLGSFEVFTTYFLGELVQTETFTNNLKVFELTPGHLEEALSKQMIDVGITYIPVARPNLDFIKVTTIAMDIYAAEQSCFHTRNFAEWPFAVPITPIVGAATRVAGLDGWPDDLVTRKCSFEVTMMESGLELARRGLAVMYLPSFIAKLHNKTVAPKFRLKRLPRPANVGLGTQNVYIVKRKSTPESTEIRKIARCLRRVCR